MFIHDVHSITAELKDLTEPSFVARKVVLLDESQISLLDTPEDIVRRRTGKVDRFSMMALRAVRSLALKALELAPPEKIGIIVGNMLGGWKFAERELGKLHKLGTHRVSAFQATAWFPAAAQGEVTIGYSIYGYSKTLSGGLFCGLEALTVATDAIALGRITAAIVGVAESLGSQIAMDGVEDLGASCIGESACFLLLTDRSRSEAAISLAIEEEAYSAFPSIDCVFASEVSGLRRGVADYQPFYLGAQPLMDIDMARRRLVVGAAERIKLKFFSANRSFHVGLTK